LRRGIEQLFTQGRDKSVTYSVKKTPLIFPDCTEEESIIRRFCDQSFQLLEAILKALT